MLVLKKPTRVIQLNLKPLNTFVTYSDIFERTNYNYSINNFSFLKKLNTSFNQVLYACFLTE